MSLNDISEFGKFILAETAAAITHWHKETVNPNTGEPWGEARNGQLWVAQIVNASGGSLRFAYLSNTGYYPDRWILEIEEDHYPNTRHTFPLGDDQWRRAIYDATKVLQSTGWLFTDTTEGAAATNWEPD
jgi:hypothetical protein